MDPEGDSDGIFVGLRGPAASCCCRYEDRVLCVVLGFTDSGLMGVAGDSVSQMVSSSPDSSMHSKDETMSSFRFCEFG